MKQRKLGVILALAGLVVAVVLFVVLRDDGEGGSDTELRSPSGANEPREAERPRRGGGPPDGSSRGTTGGEAVPTIVVRNGAPVGGVRQLSFTNGERIRFVVASDVADEVHLHGYDVMKPVRAGGKVAFAVPATIEGLFEVELEQRALEIAQVSVNPR